MRGLELAGAPLRAAGEGLERAYRAARPGAALGAAGLLVAALLGATGRAAPSQASGTASELAPALEQRLTLTPDEVRVGEPVRVRAEVWHPAGTRIEFELPPADPDSGWWWQDLSPFASRPQDDEPESAWRAVAEWTLVPLEQASARGEAGWTWFTGQTLPNFDARLIDGEREYGFELGGDPLTVTSNLSAEDMGPPPLRGLLQPRPPLSSGELWRRAGWVAGASLAVFLGGLWLTLRGTRARTRPQPAATPRQRLDRLVALRDREASGEQRRGACFELTALCRAAVDREQGAARGHLTDEEWLERVRREPGAGDAEWIPGLERLLRLCQRAKYAGEPPSGWATEELHGLAEALLARLEAEREREQELAR